nr:MAG TPA: hypothetical protein [Caudoviricetes sp.]
MRTNLIHSSGGRGCQPQAAHGARMSVLWYSS